MTKKQKSSGAMRDRFAVINEGGCGGRRSILITQSTIKPSRFVTFLIYFMLLRLRLLAFFPSVLLSRWGQKIKFNYMFEKSAISVMQNQKNRAEKRWKSEIERRKSTAKWHKLSLLNGKLWLKPQQGTPCEREKSIPNSRRDHSNGVTNISHFARESRINHLSLPFVITSIRRMSLQNGLFIEARWRSYKRFVVFSFEDRISANTKNV